MPTFPKYTNNNKHEPGGLLKYIIAPLTSAFAAALIAGFGAFIAIQKEMSAVTTSVNKMSVTVDKLAEKQTAFFESFYLPLAIKVEKQDAEIKETRASVGMLKDDMYMFHYKDRRPSYDRK
jgi:hypothetical protein